LGYEETRCEKKKKEKKRKQNKKPCLTPEMPSHSR
jgi:hypothetical protein